MKQVYKKPEVKAYPIALEENVLLALSVSDEQVDGASGGWTQEEDDPADWD